MSFELIAFIFKHRPNVGGSGPWGMLMAMANRASDDGTGIWESVPNLSEACNQSERTGWRSIETLLSKGVVVDTGEDHNCGNGHFTNIYRIEQSAILTLSDKMTGCQIDTQQSAKNVKAECQFDMQTYPTNQSPEPVHEKGREGKRSALASLACAGTSQTLTDRDVWNFLNSWGDLTGKSTSQLETALPVAKEILTLLMAQGCNLIGATNLALKLWDYNRTHKRGTKQFKVLKGLFLALNSDHEYSLVSQYQTCQVTPCPICVKEAKVKDRPLENALWVEDEPDFKSPLPKANSSASVLDEMKTHA